MAEPGAGTPAHTGELAGRVSELIGDRAGQWDVAGRLPGPLVRQLASCGLLCPDVPTAHGGWGLTSAQTGAYTAHVGSLCGSVRSLLTAQGMAAWAVRRFGDAAQRRAYLARLARGTLAGAAFTEPGAGSDLAAMATTVRADDGGLVVDGHKVWVTGARYADLLVVFGRYDRGAAAVLVPTATPGVRVEPVPAALGCRAAGHATVRLEAVRLGADALLGGVARPLGLLAATVLTYGRLSVAWGCVGILRACLAAAARHARTRQQFGVPLASHQLVARHLAELLVAEQAATRLSEHASACWDAGSPELASAAVLAKHLAAGSAVRGAAAAVQVLGSAAAHDGHPVARAYRDAKLMELIEGSAELSQLMLSEHALAAWS